MKNETTQEELKKTLFCNGA